jgi:hypothetical protein
MKQQRVGGSTKCFSIEDGCAVSEARSRRAGGASRSALMDLGYAGTIIDPCGEFLGAAGG